MRTDPVRTLVAALGAAAVLLAGCGGRDKPDPPAGTATTIVQPVPQSPPAFGNGVAALPAAQILARARTAIAAAPSYAVTVTDFETSEKRTLNLRVAGKNFAGSLTMGDAKVEVLAVGGSRYVKPNQAYWVTGGVSAARASAMVRRTAGRWVKVPAGNKDFAALFARADVGDRLTPRGELVTGAEDRAGTPPRITLVDTGADTDNATIDVATAGEPYPLQVRRDPVFTVFSGFGESGRGITRPAAARVVDLSALA